MIGSATLDAQSYEEVESDSKSNWQAVGIVLLSSFAAAIGSGATDMTGVIGILIAAITSWLLWVLLTLLIGTKVLPGKQTQADFGQILRTTGFSASPGIFRALGIVPVIGWYLFVAATVWMLFTFVVAIRQALDYESTGRALAVSLLGWLIHGLLLFGFVLTAI